MFAGLWGWLIAALGAVAGVGAIWLSGRKSGAAEAEAETAEATVETQKRMQDARAKAPRTGDAAIDRMHDGKF